MSCESLGVISLGGGDTSQVLVDMLNSRCKQTRSDRLSLPDTPIRVQLDPKTTTPTGQVFLSCFI